MYWQRFKSLREKFYEKVYKTDNCWFWIGASEQPFGYGEMKISGRLFKANRISWELENGPIPEGMKVLHSCDIPQCVNPGHLRIGTDADNHRDAMIRGRHSVLAFRDRELCANGHPYTAENITIRPSGMRYCKVCAKEAARRKRAIRGLVEAGSGEK